LLPRGWSGFVFKCPEDSELVLNKFWSFDGGSLMLKRWCLSFNPTTKYFSFRHIWVLLPSLPLQMWNLKALEAVGNAIGHFLKIDDADLLSLDKRMAKVLVEVDIHEGLLEVLEIEWRGLLFVQCLDYLGLPFRCYSLQEDRSFEKGVSKHLWLSADDDTVDDLHGDSVTPLEDAQDPMDYPGLCSEESPAALDTTFVGKLKHFCPKLYFSLSAWERDHLNSILFPDQSQRPVLETDKTFFTDPEKTALGGDSSLSPCEVSPTVG
jgi:hypothetical protein